ncbi:NEL-type E3 ubiquitin ligase domain-containing protein [Pseudomonas sp. NPDC089422]|uniref:NEL-type E3 ubiquitin ligase domain-containing protein n=1 Tax=Pseudomonas sp. NPDC089422 TaxID=3364466 RepID=UPI0038273DD6
MRRQKMDRVDFDQSQERQLATDQAFQDSFIAGRLPPWLRKLDVVQLRGLKEALQAGLACRHTLSKRLARLQGVDAFARPLLQKALAERFAVHADIDGLYFRQWYTYTAGASAWSWSRQPPLDSDYFDVPLLEAALVNFTVEQTHQGGQPRHNCLVNGAGTALSSPSAHDFAALCRQLDLGRRYQQHLDTVISPTDNTADEGRDFASVIAEMQRATFKAEAYKAYADGLLSKDDLETVLRFTRGSGLGPLDGHRVTAKRLEVLGCKLEQIVVLDIVQPGLIRDSRQRVLVHIPGDPVKPWTACEDLQSFARHELGKRLRDEEYQRFFSRFVRRRDQPEFFASVRERLGDVADWATRDLGEHMHLYQEPVFSSLASLRISQLKDDAAVLAVPVAQLDRRIQQDQQRYLESIGETLIGVAGLFVPVVGAVLLAVMAWEVLGEVFQAVEDWAAGDTHEALEHLVNVLEDMAALVAVGAAATLAGRAWKGSVMVDSLVPTQLEDGSERLWSQDLAPFRGASPPWQAERDGLGVHRLGERTWVEMDGAHYEVRHQRRSDQWQLLPVAGHGPRLRHNGAGAWRLNSERPTQWEDARWMFRRLGESFRSLDDERIDEALAIHGIGEDNLRALHVYGTAPTAELFETVQRIQGDVRIRSLVGQLRSGHTDSDPQLRQIAQSLPGLSNLPDQALAEAIWAQRRQLLQQLYLYSQPADSAGSRILRRVFPGLHQRAAQALLDAASSADVQRMLETDRVPMTLADAARLRLLNIRAVRVYEALHIDAPQNADLAQVVISLLKYLPGASSGVRWQLFDSSLDSAPRASTASGAHAFDLLHQRGQFVLLDSEGEHVFGPGELFEVMASAYSHEQWAAMNMFAPFAHNLRVTIMRLAVRHRQEVEQLLDRRQGGWFRMPQRLGEGRIGYPLSGRSPGRGNRRGRPLVLSDRVSELFPDYDQVQIDNWVMNVQESGQDLQSLLQRLRAQQVALNDGLVSWTAQARDLHERTRRQTFTSELLGVWRNSVAEASRGQATPRSYWWSRTGNGIGALPPLPTEVRFEQVAVMSLRNMQLDAVPDEFLRAFPNLQTLELTSNNLTSIPAQLAHLPRLQCLDLFNNRISLNTAQSAILASCESLYYLNLSHNPLRRGFSVHAMTQLTDLRLRNTQITSLPHGVMDLVHLRALDLRDNFIRALPANFYEHDLWLHGNVWLADEALTAAEAVRLRAALLAIPPQVVANQPSWVASRLLWQDAIGQEVRDASVRDNLATYWAEVQNVPGSDAFFGLLGRVTEVADFRNHITARDMANQLLEMLQLMRDNPELRDQLFANAGDLTCGDSVTLRFTDLRICLLVWQAEQGRAGIRRERALLRLGRQLWRLDRVDRIAHEDVQARQAGGGNPDVIEVVLAYRVGLRIDLDLPVQARTMLHGPTAGVDHDRLASARLRVLQDESGPELASSLIDREFWREHLRRTRTARFETVDEPFHERMSELMADERLTQAQVQAQTSTLQHERTAAERELMRTLTLSALDVESEVDVR